MTVHQDEQCKTLLLHLSSRDQNVLHRYQARVYLKAQQNTQTLLQMRWEYVEDIVNVTNTAKQHDGLK